MLRTPRVSRLVLIAVLLVLVAGLAPRRAGAEAAPSLALRADWYRIVDPYRYVEARRYEGGWNRGADVQAVGGVVRAPVSGRVRFVGEVAGRGIVTVDARLGGMPVVLTFTDVRDAPLHRGDTVRVGDVLGAASRLHVGAYDQARRTRYLPVVGAAATAGGAGPRRSRAASAPARVTPRPSPVADAVAGRLLAAVDGTAVATALRGDRPSAFGAVRRDPPELREAGRRGDMHATPAALTSLLEAAQPLLLAATWCGAATDAMADGTGGRRTAAAVAAQPRRSRAGRSTEVDRSADANGRTVQPSSGSPSGTFSNDVSSGVETSSRRSSGRAVPEHVPGGGSRSDPVDGGMSPSAAGSGPGDDPRSTSTWPAVQDRASDPPSTSRVHPPAPTRGLGAVTMAARPEDGSPLRREGGGTAVANSVTAGAPVADAAPSEAAEGGSTDPADGSRAGGAAGRGRRWSVAVAALLALAVAALPTLAFRRRRSRGRPDVAGGALAEPLPVLLPLAPPRVGVPLRIDESSAPDPLPIGWPDQGRVPAPQPSSPRCERAPEHA